ncbi:MAG TPA: hypothetical protein VHL08_09855 [Dongiaceae bacterium]|jgi:hypothetical protein|nr:hypothetical protein [Dongiaceae bacterium]
MTAKKNPANLNPLQLRTLTLFQAIAKSQSNAPDANGNTRIEALPHAHGDHFHLGPYLVKGSDATGMSNPAVWAALQRKGMIEGQFGIALALTPAGLEYETGLAETILHQGEH